MNNIQPINQSANNLLKRVIWNSLSKESQIAYQTDYKLFFKYINKDPKDIGPQDIMSYIDYLKKEGYRANSINRKVAALSKMFNVFVMVKEMDNNPIALLKKIKKVTMSVPKGNRSALTISDIQAIAGNTAQEKKIALIIRVLGSTGLRISEFINIKHSDIDSPSSEYKRVRVMGKRQKERFIFLSKGLYEEIIESYPEQNDYLFYNQRNNKYNRMVLWKQINEIFLKKTGKDIHPHSLRHLYATYKIHVEKADIGAVSRYMGHADVKTCLNSYFDTVLEPINAGINF